MARDEQLIESTQTIQHALLDLAVDPLVLDDQQVGAIAVGLGADEQGASCVITIVDPNSDIFKLTIAFKEDDYNRT